MNLESIERIQGRGIDMLDRGAAMRLAWSWIAQDHWSRRDFGQVQRDDLSRALKDAHACVRTARRHERQKAMADKDPRVAALREQYGMLENKPFQVSIRQEQERIDQKISLITSEMETQQ